MYLHYLIFRYFYRLPQDIYQTAKVAKVLLMLEKGKGKQFKGKCLREIELDNDVYCSSDAESELNVCDNERSSFSANVANSSQTDNNIMEMEFESIAATGRNVFSEEISQASNKHKGINYYYSSFSN